MNVNFRTGIIAIILFIILLSPILLIHAPGVSAQDLNNTSLSVGKATYVLGETVCLSLAAAQEEIVFFNIIIPEGIFYAALPSTDREHKFKPDIAGTYVVNVLLRTGDDEKFLTTGFEVIDTDPEVVFGEPKQGGIELGEHVNWSQHISITNHEGFSISNFSVSIPLSIEYSNLSSDAGFSITNSSIPVDLAAGEDVSFNISYQTPPVWLEVVEGDVAVDPSAPVVDAVTTNSGAANSFAHSHTVSGSNRLLVVEVALSDGDADERVSSVTYAGTSLTRLTEIVYSGDGPRVDVWYLVNPPTGANNVVVTQAGENEVAIGAISYTGVNQIIPIDGTTTAQGASASASISVTSETDDLVTDVMASVADGAPSVGHGQTQRWNVEMGGSGATSQYGAGSTEAGASSVTMSWTLPESEEWVITGFNINAADATAPTITIDVPTTSPPVYLKGGNWTVVFNTTGTANLTITAVNGTTWSNTNEDNDLKFLELRCGSEILDYQWINNSIFIENYSCDETGYEASKVLKAGKHTLEFRFGDDVKYAYNQAGCPTGNVTEYYNTTDNGDGTCTTTFQPNDTYGKDSQVRYDHSNNNYGTLTPMLAGPYGGGPMRSLVEFNLSSLPSTVEISIANLTLIATKHVSSDVVCNAHRLTNSWLESEVTYNNRTDSLSWDTAGGDFDSNIEDTDTQQDGEGTGTPLYFNITNLVRGWVNGTYSNYGLIVEADTSNDYTAFYTSDYTTDTSLRPKLVINYTPADTTLPTLKFLLPTPANNTYQSTNFTQINISINGPNLNVFKFNWNATNYTFYNDSLVLGMNLNNNSAIGETSTEAVDISKYGNNGTLQNMEPEDWVTGKYGYALDFDGTNEYVNVPDDTSLEPTSVTVEAWINTDTNAGDHSIAGKWRETLGFHLNPSTYNGYVLYQDGTTLKMTVGFGAGSYRTASVADAIAAGQWQHVAGTYNGTTGDMAVFSNGVEVGTASGAANAISYGTETGKIGYRITSRLPGPYFDGKIDEVRIYNRVLSPAEIKMQYQSEFLKYNTTQWYFYNNVTDLPGGTHTYYGWANDTAGNWNKTETRYLTVDSTSPTYSNEGDDSGGSVSEGTIVNVSVLWDDNVALSKGVLRTNKTGAWQNETWHDFSATPQWFNTTIDTSGYGGETICWVQWANDTSNSWNTLMYTTVHCFDVSYSTALEIRNQTNVVAIGSINFSGESGDTVSNPHNNVGGSGSPQDITSKTPVVTIYNPSSSTNYKIWLKVTNETGWDNIISDEKFNVTADGVSPGDVSSWATLTSWGSYKNSGVTVSAGTHKDLYLEFYLKGSGTGSSTLSVLGEAV